MLPHKLRLKNFLSYQELQLDFSGLHIAGIWGANGAGKSALLESIAWVIWGYSRVSNEDHLIFFGATTVKVEFIFQFGSDLFRVMRSRTRGGGLGLEWQVRVDNHWQSLTAKTVKLTQQLIISTLKMDYDTFINSAYLRQGKADEFMLKRPSDRKQILAEILNLSSYEELAERAKELARTCKASAIVRAQQIQQLQYEIQQAQQLLPQLAQIEARRQELLSAEQHDRQLWQTLQELQQELAWYNQQRQALAVDISNLQQQIKQSQSQLDNLSQILAQEHSINRRYQEYQQTSQQEHQLSEKQTKYYQLLHQSQALKNFIDKQRQELQIYLRQYHTQIEQLQHQQKDLQNLLNKAPEISIGLEKLHSARSHLENLERLQAQASPLLQRRQTLLLELGKEQAKITAQLEEFGRQQQKYLHKAQKMQALEHQNHAISEQISILKKKQTYQQRVYEKGLERRDFLERIKAHLEACQQRQTKLDLQAQALHSGEISVCPLCDRPLDLSHLAQLNQQIEDEQKQLHEEMWVLKEQQATSECEINVLRTEYKNLHTELQQLPDLLKQSGAITAELEAHYTALAQQQQIAEEKNKLEQELADQQFGLDLRHELSLIEQSLAKLNYDDKDLALARADCDRWRWAEIKQAELKNVRRQAEQIHAKYKELQIHIQQISDRLSHDHIAPPQQQELEQLERALKKLAYDPQLHQELQELQKQLTPALLEYQDLRHAQTNYPFLRQQIDQWQEQLQQLTAQSQALNDRAQSHQQQLDQYPSATELETRINDRRQQLDKLMVEIGHLQQLQIRQTHNQQQTILLQQQLENLQYRQQLAEKLQIAYGKNGIQALTIENVLPQLEAEANRLLGQLSDRQLTLRFITQKANRKQDKMIDTLDIEVADLRGTRPYETYSGGEAFRINFAIRLALARILTQRKGCTLQTLIIDEGFGSQDREGCDRLLSALNAIASEFACILVVTHMPHLKEAFSTVLEVIKTATGSVVYRHE
jgi:exonuclease SbcC